VRAEVQEISLRDKKNINSEILFKQRELERSKISLKQFLRDGVDLNEELIELKKNLEKRENLLKIRKEQEEELSKKFRKLISERDFLQEKVRQNTIEVSTKQNNVYNLEQITNNFKIDKARVGAEIENLEIEMLEFPNVEIIRASKEVLSLRLSRTQEILLKIGSVNLRSLEVYDSVKKEYDTIKAKVETISKEKESIFKVIHEIDIKKKKIFLQSLSALNEIFSRNFSLLSTKGQVFLELENKKDPFSGGINIIVKVGHGKYLDVKSLSGGEQTLVALSLIFAIQEFKPYAFYILDEIDAALDKRNSERLAHLLKKYMKNGQYIVITHNDEVISSATNIYGISMCDGISKIISLGV
jgi:chromosome segregation protein